MEVHLDGDVGGADPYPFVLTSIVIRTDGSVTDALRVLLRADQRSLSLGIGTMSPKCCKPLVKPSTTHELGT
jgi:hypothetical protein